MWPLVYHEVMHIVKLISFIYFNILINKCDRSQKMYTTKNASLLGEALRPFEN